MKGKSRLEDFPLTIRRGNGSDALLVIRGLPTGRSRPDRTPELRGVVLGELGVWLKRHGRMRRPERGPCPLHDEMP